MLHASPVAGGRIVVRGVEKIDRPATFAAVAAGVGAASLSRLRLQRPVPDRVFIT
jgi:hypothetical protein